MTQQLIDQTTGDPVPWKGDAATGAALVKRTDSAQAAAFNLTSPGAVIKTTPGRAVRVTVIVAGSAVGGVYDTNVLGSAAVGNQIAVLPNTVGPIDIDWPCATGITVVPGTGQTVAVSYV